MLFQMNMTAPNKLQGWAYNVTTVQTTVDTRGWQILASVVDENVGAFLDHATPNEGKRYSFQELSVIANTKGTDMEQVITMLEGIISVGSKDPAIVTNPEGGNVNTSNLVMTFPGKIEGIIWHKSSTANDADRASSVVTALGFSINDAFSFANGGNYTPSGSSEEERVKKYGTDMVAFLRAVDAASKGGSGSYNGYTFTLPSDAETANMRKTDSSLRSSDFVKISKGGASSIFQYRIKKGYVSGSENFGLFQTAEDIEYLNWAVFAYEAFGNFLMTDENLRVIPENVYASNPNSFEKMLVGMLSSICDFIKNALGLWGVDELVFNVGVRGSAMYAGGIYPTSWEPVVWALFFISELGAFLVLAIAILQNVLKKAMSTVNPVIRASLMQQVKDILAVAIVLGLLPVLLQMLVSLSGTFCTVMSDAIGQGSFSDRFKTLSAQGGTLGGLLLQIFYLGMLVTLNVFYMIRSYTVALLIILSPIFVVFFAMGENKKTSGKQWLGELAGNIFMQPIHALVLGAALLFPSTARPIETLALFYAFMPISNVIRGLMFGNGGGGVLGLAQKGVSNAKNKAMQDYRMAKGASKALAAGGSKLIGRWTTDKNEEAKGGSESEGRSAEAQSDGTLFSSEGAQERTYPSADTRSGRDQTMQTAAKTGYFPSSKQSATAKTGTAKPTGKINGKQILKDVGTATGAIAGAAIFGPGAVVAGGAALLAGRKVGRFLSEGDKPKEFNLGPSQLRNEGFESFKVRPEGGSIYKTTDTGYQGMDKDGKPILDEYRDPTFSEAEVESYASMAYTFAHGTDAEKEALKSIGFDGVKAEVNPQGKPTGKFQVKTNKNFQKRMGYSASYGRNGGVTFSSIREDETLPRVPLNVSQITSPKSYERQTPQGTGYTKTGIQLSASKSGTPTPSKTTISAQSYSRAAMSGMGMSVAAAPSGGTEVTYDAGLIGKDSFGAQVYKQESPMTIEDRENLAVMKDMYESGSESDKAWLSSQGIQSVTGDDSGSVKVVYTEAAQQVLGGSIRASEDGGAVVTQTTPDIPVNIVPQMSSPSIQESASSFQMSQPPESSLGGAIQLIKPHETVKIPKMDAGLPNM